MNDDDELCDPIIPKVVLDAALAGKEISRNVRKRSAMDSDVNIEESSDEEKRIKSRTKRSSLKQTSLGAFFTMPSRGERWEPLHKQLPSAKKTIVKKRIAIDALKSEKATRISPVVMEVSNDKSDICKVEQSRLKRAILHARRNSIKQYATKLDNIVSSMDQEKTDRSNHIQRKSTMTTNHRQNEDIAGPSSESRGAVSLSETRSESSHSVGSEIVVLDSPRRTPDSESSELEILCEIPSSVTPYSNKRLCYSTPRTSHKSSVTTGQLRCRNHNRRRDYTKRAKSTPRCNPLQQRLFSPLYSTMDDEECICLETPVIRRRRPKGEKSIFDLSDSGEEIEAGAECSKLQCPSSTTVSVKTNLPKVIFDNEGNDPSVELCDTTAVPSSSTSDCSGNDRTKGTPVILTSYPSSSHAEEIGSSNNRSISRKEELRTNRNADISYRDSSVKNINDSEGSTPASHPKPVNDVLETVQVSSSKSSFSTLTYSPRKMQLNNAQRLKTILAKTNNHFEYLPNLGKPLSVYDYCAFEVPFVSNDGPPISKPRICEDKDLNFGNPAEFVRLPWSTANIVNGFHRCLFSHIIFDRALRALVQDGAHCIEAVIVTLRQCAPWLKSFNGLHSFMDSLSPYEQRGVLDVMVGIAKLAVNSKFILTSPLPLLRANRSASVTLSQEQCACLLAHAFFCTYRRERPCFNRINMASILDGRNPMCHVKLRFILHYFAIVVKNMPTGCVSFRREALPPNLIPNWEEEQGLMPLMATASDNSIEDSYGCLQVDFANEFIGGGVLNWGAVQEEIRFLICPEMIVSCLLCEKMGPLEVVHIVGAQRYSSYVGYGQTLCWAPYEEFGSEPRDEFRRIKCEVVAMDATLFKSKSKRSQYDKVNIDRELNKAYIGFMSTQREVPPIATGNWGCGAFGGDKELKILIQLMAAARAGRDMIYYTFGDPSFAYYVNEQYEKIIHKKASIGAIYKALISYQKERNRNPHISVFDHVYAILSEITCTAS